MKRSSRIVIRIDDDFKSTLRDQLINNHYLGIQEEEAEDAYRILVEYLELSPKKRVDIEKMQHVVGIMTAVFEPDPYTRNFLPILTFFLERMQNAEEERVKLDSGRGFALMLYQFCYYINGLSMKY